MPSRGDVLTVQLDPIKGSEQAGTRPAIVVSRNSINHAAIGTNRTTVIVIVPVTDRRNLRRLYPSHVELEKGLGGLTMDSVALCEQVRAITVDRLVRFMGSLPAMQLNAIEEALRITLQLD
jgi:mRNA interferase MazF